jgi:glycogen synthase
MLGWELPPFHSGGLGMACMGLTKGLSSAGVEVDFVLPKKHGGEYPWMNVFDASSLVLQGGFSSKCIEIAKKNKCTLVNGYQRLEFDYEAKDMCQLCFSEFDSSPFGHVNVYIRGVKALAYHLDFDIIHAHDWMTYQAGLAAKKVALERGLRVPLLCQAHATEIDRHDGKHIYNIEKLGFEKADHLVAVSGLTKNTIVDNYSIDPKKISVVYNGIDPREVKKHPHNKLKSKHKVVLFLGRITFQKGPDYFVKVAKKVTQNYKNVKFMMLGSGDMQTRIIELAAKEGLTGKLLFNSWITDEDKDEAYQLADVFVMPSVSEPFGIVPLEAIQNGTPVVVSKKSGVAEVIHNSVKVDFWDIDKMAAEITHLLDNTAYAKDLVKKAQDEIKILTWDKSAKEMKKVYNKVLSKEKEYA